MFKWCHSYADYAYRRTRTTQIGKKHDQSISNTYRKRRDACNRDHKKSGLHRHLVYEALRDLEMRGLVKRLIKSNIAHFRIQSADPLLHEAEKQYEAATEVARVLRQHASRVESSVTFYEGIEGVHAFTEFVLAQGEHIDVLGANARFRQYYPEIFSLWNERRLQKKMRFRALAAQDVPDEHLYDVPGVTIRRYDGRLFPGVAWIFGNHLAHIVWKTRQNTEIILLKQPDLANQHRELFSALWRLAR